MERNKSTIFLTVIAIATLLVAVVGATFAYFSTTVTGNETAKSVIIKAGTLGITYTNGNEINTTGTPILPGWNSGDKTFTIQNTGDVEMSYDIKWANVTNNFENKEDLTYTLSCTSDDTAVTNPVVNIASTQLPDTAGNISTDVKIAGGKTHTCTLVASYANTSSEQNSDMGKQFAGVIHVDVNSVTSSVAPAAPSGD